MKASKGNKEYVINGDQVKAYQDSGFDVKHDCLRQRKDRTI